MKVDRVIDTIRQAKAPKDQDTYEYEMLADGKPVSAVVVHHGRQTVSFETKRRDKATEDSIARVAEFIRQHEMRTGADPEIIHRVFSDPDGQRADLFASDLKALVAAARKEH